MRDKLYLHLQKRSPLYAYFMYFDAIPYLADELFIRHKVRVWVKKEWAKEGFPYHAIMCRVKKKDVLKFLAALEDLKKSMSMDYAESVSAFLDEIEQNR